MSFWRVLLSILFPPLAVVDQGCGSVLIVFLLTLCGWVPGVIAALVIFSVGKFGKFGGRDHIAVLEVANVIVDDQDRSNALLKVAKNKSVKALVVHINSPGGTVVGGSNRSVYRTPSPLEGILLCIQGKERERPDWFHLSVQVNFVLQSYRGNKALHSIPNHY